MRLAFAAAPLIAFFGVATLPASPVAAAEGDRWAIDRQNVNVRAGPSTSTDVLMTINPGESIVEIASKGEWFFVAFPDRAARGWIFGPLLVKPAVAAATRAAAPAAPEKPAQPEATSQSPTPEPTSVTTPAQPKDAEETQTQAAVVPAVDEPAAVKSFRDTVSELNDRAVSVAGINLFSDVRSTGGGGVQVLATETWANVPEAGQSSYMNALFDRWQSVANGLGPLSLQIVDPTGQVMMERTGS
ncbi:MAG: SH3 domain-containing protein [Geminicoccaceae bacterium]